MLKIKKWMGAILNAMDRDRIFVRRATEKYQAEALTPLISIDSDLLLTQEREEIHPFSVSDPTSTPGTAPRHPPC